MQDRWRELVLAAGAGVMVVMLAVPALVPMLPVGVWDQDPRVLAAMSGGGMGDGSLAQGLVFGPAGGVWWFVGTVVIAGLVWVGCGWARGWGGFRTPMEWVPVGLMLIGMVGVGWWMNRGYEHLFVGAGWLAAGAAGLAGWALGRSPAGRRWAAGGLAGLAVWLGLDAVYEVVVEAARNAAFWEAEGESILRARGFEPGSASAELLARRTLSPGAVGGYGLANVLGTVAAGLVGG
ncbi:MAG: hypothetical protein AAGI68_10340, partial [Planctomycetota bacterium]